MKEVARSISEEFEHIKADASSGASRAIGSIGWGWDPVVEVEHEKPLLTLFSLDLHNPAGIPTKYSPLQVECQSSSGRDLLIPGLSAEQIV